MIACPRCHTIQPMANINTGRLHRCPGCGNPIRADVFNAFLRANDAEGGTENDPAAARAECFYHPGKPAITTCDACGRMLCGLCRVEMNERSLCLQCLQVGRDKNKLPSMQHQRILNDSIALHLAFWPMGTVFFTVLTAPAALFFAARHWRAPAGILPRRFFKSVLATLLAVGQIVGWAVFFIEQFG